MKITFKTLQSNLYFVEVDGNFAGFASARNGAVELLAKHQNTQFTLTQRGDNLVLSNLAIPGTPVGIGEAGIAIGTGVEFSTRVLGPSFSLRQKSAGYRLLLGRLGRGQEAAHEVEFI